jgi:Ca-activated chloride channel family protein
MSPYLFRSALIVVALLAAVPLTARQQETATFRSSSDLVVLHVNVFDGKSDAVPDLPQSAFQVFENEMPQEITFFGGADVPVAVGLIIDNSGSMIARHRMVVAGGLTFAESSHPEDELFTIHFNENVRYGLPDGMLFTNRNMLLRAALARYPAGGKTALHDAVIAGLAHVGRSTHQKRVLVVLSDGEDNASLHSENEMLGRARANDAIIYTVSSAQRDRARGGNPDVLRDLAEITGGEALFPKSEDAVVGAFNEIAANIRRGYSIGYVPSNGSHDGSYRRVKVTVRVPGRGNLSVRSRHGYTATAVSGAQ